MAPTLAYPSPTSSVSPASPTSSSTSSCLPPRRKARVSAEHTLTRVRENQRRHRARKKDYITTLEEKLASTEKQLAEALAEIEKLRRERDSVDRPVFCDHEEGDRDGNGNEIGSVEDGLREKSADMDMNTDMAVGSDTNTTEERHVEKEDIPAEYPDDATPIPIPTEIATILEDFWTTQLDNLPSPIPPPTQTGPPPCCEDIPTPSSPSSTPDPECSSCHERPAPSPSESTTLCAQAYAMIQQQNFRDIDAGTIRLWLYQGYRRAQSEGEGCRVENGALFRLLDYISGEEI